MTSFDRFERSLPSLLDELAIPRIPDYFDDVLARTAATRQRPGWSFPERWFLMSVISQRLGGAVQVPWRLAALVALLLVAALIGVLVAGSQSPRVPAPFGPAANGRVAFLDQDGRINLGDVLSGESTIIVQEGGNDRVSFSPDGARLAFVRSPVGSAGVDLLTVRTDSTDLRVLTAAPMVPPTFIAWSPAGDRILVTHPGTLELYGTSGPGEPVILSRHGEVGTVTIGSDGHNPRTVSVFRPPTGAELLFVNNSAAQALAAIGPDGTGYRELINSGSGLDYVSLLSPQWSPDGSQVVVGVEVPGSPSVFHLYLVNADGSNLRPLSDESLDPLIDMGHATWSPDGSQIAFQRWTRHADDDGQDFHPLQVVDVATGASRFVGRTSANGYLGWEWSPDGKSILAAPGDESGDLILIDATTGDWTATPWSVEQAVSWQRTLD